MRIDYHPHTPYDARRAQQARRPGAEFGVPGPAPDGRPGSATTPAEDVVQLALGADGIWKVTAPSASRQPTGESSQTFSGAFPRMSRLYHTFLDVYSPQGLAQAFGHARGMLVDLYA